jgi:hypothetical protein
MPRSPPSSPQAWHVVQGPALGPAPSDRAHASPSGVLLLLIADEAALHAARGEAAMEFFKARGTTPDERKGAQSERELAQKARRASKEEATRLGEDHSFDILRRDRLLRIRRFIEDGRANS